MVKGKAVNQLGNWLKGQNIKDVRDTALDVALFAVGWRSFQNPIGGLLGPISLRLAQSPNLASGASGVAGLTLLGLASNPDVLTPAFQLADVWAPNRDVKAVPPWAGCPKGYTYSHKGTFWKFCSRTKA